MTAAAGAPEAPQIVPRVLVPRNGVLPALIAGSLLLHATVLLPLLLHRDTVSAPPLEIPVELVRAPPPAPEKAAPKAVPAAKPAVEKPKPAAEKPKPAAEKPKPAPEKPKPAEKRLEPPKRPARKPPAQKAPKPPAPKAAAPAVQKPVESVAERMQDLLGAMPAIALPGAAQAGTDSVSYSQLVLSQLAKAKKQGRYPGQPGQAGVAFTLGDSGEVVSVEVVRPSGIASLDEEAVAMVKRGAPYPPPPPGGRRDYAITLRFAPA